MIKNILFSALFMLIGYSSFAQSGRYVVVLNDGLCQDVTSGVAVNTWYVNPKIIVIDPNGVITETNLNTATSMADVIAHEAAFNVVISDIMNQGYTMSFGGGNALSLASTFGVSLGFPDAPCPAGNAVSATREVTLIPCCAP